MKTARWIDWRRGGVLLGLGIGTIVISAWRWEIGVGEGAGESVNLSVWGGLMLAGLALAAVGVIFAGRALGQAVLKRMLVQSGLRVRVDAVMVSKKRNGRRYFIYAKCISPFTGQEVWVSSCPLAEDPKPYLKNGVEVLFDARPGPMSYMLVDDLRKDS